jgi:hypothetical protein
MVDLGARILEVEADGFGGVDYRPVSGGYRLILRRMGVTTYVVKCLEVTLSIGGAQMMLAHTFRDRTRNITHG